MMKKLTKLLVALLCFSLLLAVPLSASAENAHVVDEADLLTADEEARLTQKLDLISREYEQDIVVVTVNSLDGKDVQLYADDYYDDNDYGMGDTQSGILLLICMGTREYAISPYGDAIDIFDDSALDALEYAFLDYLSSGYYYDAFDAYAYECAHILKYDGRLTPIWILVALIVGVAVAWIVVGSMRSKHKSVRTQRAANSYMLRDTFRLDRSRDIFLFSHVTRTVKPKNNSSSSGGGRSSSGRSHGGRSGSF